MIDPTIGSLRVNGATLHYEVRGQGPLLLLIPGGAGGAASFDGVADGLAAEYTVATYDPRGMSRSTLDDPEAEQRVAEHADDAFRMLELLSPGEPARVFGASSGAIAALHLLTAHPERVERVVAHEPPVVEVLPDASEHRALIARVQETLRTKGLMPAMAVFAAGLKNGGDTTEPKPEIELPRFHRFPRRQPHGPSGRWPTCRTSSGASCPASCPTPRTSTGWRRCRTGSYSPSARSHAANCPTARPPSWPSDSARNSSSSPAGTPA